MSNTLKKENNQNEDFDRLRQYILSCPTVPKESPAIAAALSGLDTEWKRMERDAKLKRKFTSTAANTSTKIKPQIEKEPTTTITNQQRRQQQQTIDDDLLEEWQDVSTGKDDECSSLGNRLSQAAISEIARRDIKVQTPLAAIALALHAALVSDEVGFICTGVPEKKTKGGFAAPVRQITFEQFLPNSWDSNSSEEIGLRYRKEGSMVLRVVRIYVDENETMKITLGPQEGEGLLFPAESHLNLESFAKALKKDGRVAPALHYKALPALLTKMCRTFDVGSLEKSSSLPYVDTTVLPPASNDPLQIPTPTKSIKPCSKGHYNPHDTPTLALFDRPRPGGDFSSDLHPPGLTGMDVTDGMSGNLLGPNHPMFQGGRSIGGGLGMRPRFDPIGPPGGPQDLNPNNIHPLRRPPPGGLGDPNPDHARPPQNLNNNMFM